MTESPFEGAVAAALATKGWRIDTQIGASSFRVDLGVVHPDLPGRYLAGIECDGATYHRSATARDRDKLREQVLRELGWKIVRIWSTDWWVNPGGTLERVHAQLSSLLDQDRSDAQARSVEDSKSATTSPPSDEEAEVLSASTEYAGRPLGDLLETGGIGQTGGVEPAPMEAHLSPNGPTLKASRPADAVPLGAVSAVNFYESNYDPVLRAMIMHIVAAEGPILDAVLARRIARAHGFQRTGGRIQERVDELAKRLLNITKESAGLFYWPDNCPPGAPVEFRSPADAESVRGVEEICEQELIALARLVVRSGQFGEAALVAMAREIGLLRLRAASRAPLEAALRIAAQG